MADRPYRDLATFTNLVLAILAALMLSEAASAVFLVIQDNLLVSLRDHTMVGDYMQAARTNDSRLNTLVVLSQIGVIVMIVMFLIWIYRAVSNVHALGAVGVDSPGWAVGCFFIPFVNLVAPYTAMSQVWRGSLSPGHWESETSPLVGVWWALWLVINLGGVVIGLIGSGQHHIADLIFRTQLGIGYRGLEIARDVVMAIMVYRVRAMQAAQWHVADNFGGVPGPIEPH
jgi:hypothetical protein